MRPPDLAEAKRERESLEVRVAELTRELDLERAHGEQQASELAKLAEVLDAMGRRAQRGPAGRDEPEARGQLLLWEDESLERRAEIESLIAAWRG